ncbi:uncharacterized protein LOC133119269 [Conger conger]|uniref:uncharacterized protein LOC133119269 n=1 Tax=Conger conger TaxID=82655 RepID=UPI002A5A04E1|nr:uncharacterized protein LOC133119269 [Conger conger]
MSRQLQSACLLVVLLTGSARTARFIPQAGVCGEAAAVDEPPCEEERLWTTLVGSVDKGIVTDFSNDDGRLIVNWEVLAKIKETPEYGCIMKQVYWFFGKVLNEGQKKWGRDYNNLIHAITRLKSCKVKVHCPKTCKEINNEAKKLKLRKVRDESDLSARELATFQIKKLQRAKRRVAKCKRTWERAVIELKQLHYYQSNKEVRVNCPG